MDPRSNQSPPPVDVARLNLLLIGFGLLGLALYVVVKTMQGGTNSLIAAVVMIGGIIWIVAGRRAWWMPVPIATSIGGLVWVGFRIYSYELAMLMAAAALFPALAINRRASEQHRGHLVWVAYALPIYLALHLFASLVMNYYDRGEGYGNIVRTYTGSIWAILIVLAFFHYGESRLIRRAVILVYFGLLFRVLLGLYSYYFPGFIFFRGFDVFFLLSEYGPAELRESALRLLIVTLGLSAAAKNRGATVFHLIIAILATWLLLMGSGRATVVMMGAIVILWLVIQRRFALLLFALMGMASVIAFINLNPGVLYLLPDGPQRALSILVFGDILDIQARLAGSNLWHQELFKLGFQRWTHSILTFFVGNRIFPFDPTMGGYRTDFYHSLHVAASIARYERALWTVVATTGLVGAFLYVSTFIALLRNPIRALFRNRIKDFTHFIYFLATAHTFLYVLFSPVSGYFPGVELMWAGLAFALYRDEEKRKTNEQLSASESPATKNPNIVKSY
ncbi:MAG: hypothetical protein M9963_03295 [Kiritimatiellae bacterium]|nr:hypothetical protein [Kiritimatiellia bacterium]